MRKDSALNSKALAPCFVFCKNVNTEEKFVSRNNWLSIERTVKNCQLYSPIEFVK